MLRIHFASDDLVRVRLAPAADPLWETLLSLHLLRKRDGAVVFGDWKRRVLPKVAEPSLRALFALAPPWGYSVDFLTPTAGTCDIKEGIDTVLTTPKARLAADIARLDTRSRSTESIADLAAGGLAPLRRLGAALRGYFNTALKPYWNTIQAHVHADRTLRANLAVEGGTESLLGGLHPAVRWESPALVIDYPYERDVHLCGRGLLLVPSFFCWLTPVMLRDADLPPVLVYPIDHSLGWSRPRSGDRAAHRSLAALLGRTRATVLKTLAEAPGLTTTQLADGNGPEWTDGTRGTASSPARPRLIRTISATWPFLQRGVKCDCDEQPPL